MSARNFIKDVLLGVATGDALGVPVEFRTRGELKERPVTGMLEYGTHNQPAGTWSDDSSLTFCLAEMLCKGYDLHDLANRFINWMEYGYWTPHGEVFDIGIATAAAIHGLQMGDRPVMAGGRNEESNGNGSLMRILPLLFYVKDLPVQQRFHCVEEVSSITHGHIRSIAACFIYIEFALAIMQGMDKHAAYKEICSGTRDFLTKNNVLDLVEQKILGQILEGKLPSLQEADIHSSGYVIHTLETAIWCLLTTRSYKEAVLKAVNLGSDTDTSAAVTGGLAALLYGWETIPTEWLNVLARRTDIEDLVKRLDDKL
ncbi:ADP-ribosylglycohydrolase family protein [uncultured Chitinophaga sp.]|mgnify:CR=1 FL=1|jgi:ADP-ribosylglycohydrolase|uniref:ADP-ribosylglycohydrolase family protein n=1 Tax=uncultured Chitinophaga sp. TaxID=339340 RepID=UPI00262BB4F3|nr:ADP-ribosylglycohydrolase family protein [uncultured Chitinophaga sp.]